MTKLFNFLKENIALLVILLLSSVLRIYHADYQSLWIDEINTMVQANPGLSFSETYKTLLALDLQPPLYFYILKYLFWIFGYTTLLLRLYSATLGILGVFGIYLLGREIYNKRTGLFAAAILSVNLYHIYYSQEGRPYTFFVLFTIFSFYRLLCYLKQPGYKNAIYYGIFSALMLYGHPYGFFSLFAQCIILAYYFFHEQKEYKLHFIKTSLLAGLTTVILYLPGVEIFLNAANVKSFWLEMPGPDVYARIFKEFFTDSEFLISVLYLLLFYFFIKVFNETPKSPSRNLTEPSLRNVFFILIIWLVSVTLIPLIRSYLTVPMIVSRYMIGLIPAIILMAAIALAEIKQKLIANIMLLLILVFSFTHIFIVRKYYTSFTKHDLRAAAEFVLENKTDEEPIASRIGWHYGSYYLRNIKNPILMNSFDVYVEGIMKDSLNSKPFWYVDGQSVVESVTPQHQAFLDKYFILNKKINLYGSTANHYQPVGKTITPLLLKDFSPVGPTEYGFIPFYGNGFSKSKPAFLDAGEYKLFIGGRSQPDLPIDGVNARITAKINNLEIGNVFLSEQHYHQTPFIKFTLKEPQEVAVELIYDNDIQVDKSDRNALVFSVYIEKL